MKCRQCNAEIPRRLFEQDSFRCPECGKVYRKRPQPQQQPMQRREPERQGGMVCPQCGSRNISVQFVQTSAATKSKFNTRYKRRGCLYWIYLICFGWIIELIKWCCFFWVPMLIKSVSKGKSKTKFKNKKMMVCNNCGYSHEIR